MASVVHLYGHMEKPFDYYAGYPGQQATPKWIGVALGSLFGVMLLVGVGVCVHLLAPARSAQASTAPPIAPPPAASIVAPPAPSAPVAVADDAPAADTHAGRHHGHASKHGKAKGHAAVAKASPAKYKKAQLYAKSVSHKDKKSRDEIDRLLGL